MAEFVELRIEEMIPELEQMERVKIFNSIEIKQIIKRRKALEYKTQKKTKEKKDYLQYIEYETSLLSLIQLRREKIGYRFKKHEIEYAIASRINRLYKKLILRFQYDINLWLSHIDFCKKMKWTTSVSRIFVRMLQVHSDKPNLWIQAARWEAEENKSVENARGLLLRGLRFHPQSKDLYLEAFHLELLYIEKLLKRREVLGIARITQAKAKDSVLDCRLVELIYSDAIAKIPEPELILQFMFVAKQFEFTSSLQEKMLSDLEARHAHHPLTWDTKARQKLEPRMTVVHVSKEFLSLNGFQVQELQVKFKERLQKCCSVYEEGLKVVEDAQELWSLYLNTLLELLGLPGGHHVNGKLKCYLQAVRNASESGQLEEKHYIRWLQILNSTGKSQEVLEVAKVAVEHYPQSHELWQERLKSFFGTKGSEETVLEVFWLAVSKLGDSAESLKLWETVLPWLVVCNSNSIETVYKEALKRKPVVAVPLKSDYLRWISLQKGINKARVFYAEQCVTPPFSCEFHMLMARVESAQPCLDVEKVRKCYEMAVDQFGDRRPDIWMDYVKFDQQRGNGENVSKIHWRASKSLKPHLADQFQNEFLLMKTQQ